MITNEFNLRFGSRDDKGLVIGLAQSIGESLMNFADKLNLEEVDQGGVNLQFCSFGFFHLLYGTGNYAEA
ncbi:MAG: hypothetical protein E7249_04940 [Paenibacillaceae bacterium]|nr:hypothetical protein [Paenibacillaceae bacterium]